LSVLLFDLGGVLVENAGIVDNLNAMLGDAVDEAAMKERWLRSPAARDFELGRVSPEVFAARFLEEWGSSMEADVFLTNIVGWLGHPYPGAADLLTQLRVEHHVSCLSNCNELHWAELTDFLKNFDSVFSSHLLGEIKPDEEAFRAVMYTLGARPEQITFFDDVRPNVEAASRLGIRAFLVVGFDELRLRLVGEGLL
jgi:HAD superfamily hydrolase (TIGR01509 family)